MDLPPLGTLRGRQIPARRTSTRPLDRPHTSSINKATKRRLQVGSPASTSLPHPASQGNTKTNRAHRTGSSLRKMPHMDNSLPRMPHMGNNPLRMLLTGNSPLRMPHTDSNRLRTLHMDSNPLPTPRMDSNPLRMRRMGNNLPLPASTAHSLRMANPRPATARRRRKLIL